MAAQSDHAVLDAHGDGVEDVAVTHAVIFQLLAELGLQLLVGNAGAGHLDFVADRGHALGYGERLFGVGLVLIEVHGACKGGDAVVHGHAHILELLLVQPRLTAAAAGLCCCACAPEPEARAAARESWGRLRRAPASMAAASVNSVLRIVFLMLKTSSFLY